MKAITSKIFLKDDHQLLVKEAQQNEAYIKLDASQKAYIKKVLDNANVTSTEDFPNNVSRFYCTVILRDIVQRINIAYTLVPPNESNANGEISALSPFGITLMGLAKGDAVKWGPKNNSYVVSEVVNKTFV